MEPFDPYHISRETDFKLGWDGDKGSAYSPFFTDGYAMISKRHIIGEQWFKVLSAPAKTNYGLERYPTYKSCGYFEKYVSRAIIRWAIKGADRREGEHVAVLISETKNSCLVSIPRIITVLSATQATEIYGQISHTGALAFWKESEPVAVLMPMNLKRDYQDK